MRFNGVLLRIIKTSLMLLISIAEFVLCSQENIGNLSIYSNAHREVLSNQINELISKNQLQFEGGLKTSRFHRILRMGRHHVVKIL